MSSRPGRPPTTLGCRIDGCDRKHSAKGLCRLHYVRQSRYGTTEVRPVTLGCSVDGCDREHRAHGLCGMHNARQQSHGTTDAPEPRPPEDRRCDATGCDRPHVARGWCDRHYRQHTATRCTVHGCAAKAQRAGKLCLTHWRAAHPEAPRCERDGCEQPTYSHGMCWVHWRDDRRRAKHATLSAEIASWEFSSRDFGGDFDRAWR